MRVWPFLLVAAALLPASASAAARRCDDGRLGHLENALTADRMIQADRMFTELQRACGDHPRFAMLRARYALQSGSYAQAYGLYVSLAGRDPSNAEFAAGAGRAALYLGQADQALEWLGRATALPGADWRAWNAVAILHDRRGEWDEAGRAYERAVQLAPYEPAVWSNRGYSMMLQRRPSEAVSYLDRAVELDPSNATIRRTREVAYALNGTYDDAQRANETPRAWAERLNNIGYAAWLAGDSNAARRLLARAIEVSDARFERAEHNLARVEGRE